MAREREVRGKLVLIPWHIGHWRDVTLRALDELRRLRVLLVEESTAFPQQLKADYEIDCSNKELVEIGMKPDRALLARCFGWLEHEDVGIVSSSGTPCFIDPGAWLVRELRDAGVELVVLAGASALTAALSASGIEWTDDRARFTFTAFRSGLAAELRALLRARRREPLVLFVAPEELAPLRALLREHAPDRRWNVMSNLSKLSGRGASERGDADLVVIVEPVPRRVSRLLAFFRALRR